MPVKDYFLNQSMSVPISYSLIEVAFSIRELILSALWATCFVITVLY